MSELPQGWTEAPLEDCVDILDSLREPINSDERKSRVNGKAPEELFPYYGATGQVGTIDDFIFDEELVALGEDGAPFLEADKCKAYMLRGKTWVNNHAHVLRGKKEVLENTFLCHFLNQFDYRGFVNGGTRLKLTQANMRRIPLRIAPAAEQKRIAQKLGELLGQIDALKVRIDAIPSRLKRFRQSVLMTAFSGGLKVDGKCTVGDGQAIAKAHLALGDESIYIPNTWGCESLEAIIDARRKLCYGVVQPGIDPENGIDMIRVCDIDDGRIAWHELRKIAKSVDLEYRRSRVADGDILLSIVGSIGRAAVVRGDKEANIARAVARISPNLVRVLPEWIFYWLSSQVVQWWLVSSSKEVARKTLNLKELSELPIPLPSLPEQTEIVRRVEQLFSFADQLDAKVIAAKSRVDSLTQSILAKAFRGELVPQDPNDEPASVLLERIRAKPCSTPKSKRCRTKA